MSEETMPATDVPTDDTTPEVASYECAFHILPTVADEEVPAVVDALKSRISQVGGIVTDEEVSERYDLAYEITKKIDGASKRFNIAYFGWIRFTLVPGMVPSLQEEIMRLPEILRFLIVRLTRAEAQRPFSIFETRRAQDALTAGQTGRAVADETDEMPDADPAELAPVLPSVA